MSIIYFVSNRFSLVTKIRAMQKKVLFTSSLTLLPLLHNGSTESKKFVIRVL